jgi:hypothetical protein
MSADGFPVFELVAPPPPAPVSPPDVPPAPEVTNVKTTPGCSLLRQV